MDRLVLNMQLDPAIKVANWFSDVDDVQNNRRYGALVIATDGTYRFTSPKELFDKIEQLKEHVDVDVIGTSDYVLIFNDHNILNVGGEQYFVGSTFVVKMGETCLELVSEDEIDDIRELFGGRMVELKLGENKLCSAYELG